MVEGVILMDLAKWAMSNGPYSYKNLKLQKEEEKEKPLLLKNYLYG